NVVLSTLAVRPQRSWDLRYPLTPGRYMRGAVFARCTGAGGSFVVVGSQLATDPAERPGQAHLLKKALADLDVPAILAVELKEAGGGDAGRTLADGLADAAAENSRGTHHAIFVDPRIVVTSFRVVDSPAARRASRHLPVLADLTLPG